MNKLLNVFLSMNDLEDFAMGQSWLHRFHPLFKFLCSFVLIICVLTTYHPTELFVYSIMLLIVAKSINLSIKKLIKRGFIGLPLSLCLGISYIFTNHRLISLYGLVISEGVFLCLIIFMKTFLCLCIAYLLICTTPFHCLASELIYIKVPSVFVLQLTMTYRYIFVFLHEAQMMTQAYLLRSSQSQAIAMKDMGSFIGHLLVSSMNQSQHIYNCMKCRGFDVKKTYVQHTPLEMNDYFLMMIIIGCFVLIKAVL